MPTPDFSELDTLVKDPDGFREKLIEEIRERMPGISDEALLDELWIFYMGLGEIAELEAIDAQRGR